MTFGMWQKVQYDLCVIYTHISTSIIYSEFIGLKKKLQALAKEKDCFLVGECTQSIINHLIYWCASSTLDGNGDMMVAKWLSSQVEC